MEPSGGHADISEGSRHQVEQSEDSGNTTEYNRDAGFFRTRKRRGRIRKHLKKNLSSTPRGQPGFIFQVYCLTTSLIIALGNYIKCYSRHWTAQFTIKAARFLYKRGKYISTPYRNIAPNIL